MPPLAILHLIDEFRLGGAQTHLVTMLREAVHAYPQIAHRVLSLFGDGDIAGELRQLGIDVAYVDLRPYFAHRRFLAAAGVLVAEIRRTSPTVVESHLTWSRLLGLYAAWRAGVPVRIGFEHGDLYLNSWKLRVCNFLGQCFAQRIIVCSQALGDWVRATHKVSRRRLQVLHNCVDPTLFHRQNADPVFRESLSRAPQTTLFCAVGTLGRGVNKRVDVCVRALAAAREQGADVALVICGDGEQRSELQALAAALGAAEHIHFLGMRDDIPRVMNACDGFCHAAPFEPFGIVALEAQACELPALVPNSGGIPEAITEGATGFTYPPLDHQALAHLMVRLHRDPELRRSLGRNGRVAVEQRFSVQAYVRRLYQLYGLVGEMSDACPPSRQYGPP